ncbi:MAG: dihydroorotase [Bacillota bacterium]|nr:dihydroorotase [Bacillota bacterium]
MAECEKLSALGIDIRLFNNFCILPGFTDVHVHLREPGFLYKETVATGTKAAAAGGFADIMSMPNLKPVPDCTENLKVQLDAIAEDACVHVYPYGAITIGQMGREGADLESMAGDVIAFTDDGKGVMDDELMRDAMIRAKHLNKLIVAHCEDENYPKESSEAEWMQLKRDLELVRETGCAYHMCHVSTKESVELIRQAKAEGLDVTAETAPHYLVFNRDNIEDDGRFKMNPPIKQEEDRLAVIEGLKDGTIDMIATDHAPHSAEEKNGGMSGAAFGIVGLETCMPVMYKYMVEPVILNMDQLVRLMYINPRERFGLDAPDLEHILAGDAPSFAIWNLEEEYTVNPEEFETKGRSTPFDGMTVKGRCVMTVVDGKVVYSRFEEK